MSLLLSTDDAAKITAGLLQAGLTETAALLAAAQHVEADAAADMSRIINSALDRAEQITVLLEAVSARWEDLVKRIDGATVKMDPIAPKWTVNLGPEVPA